MFPPAFWCDGISVYSNRHHKGIPNSPQKHDVIDTNAQLWVIGYFAKISSILLKALSAAACGVAPSFMISAHAVCHTCSFWTWAYAGL